MDATVKKCFDALAHFEHGRASKYAARLSKLRIGNVIQSFVAMDAMYTDMKYSRPKKLFGRLMLGEMLAGLYHDCVKEQGALGSRAESPTAAQPQLQPFIVYRRSMTDLQATTYSRQLLSGQMPATISAGTQPSTFSELERSSMVSSSNSLTELPAPTGDASALDYIKTVPALVCEVIRVRLGQTNLLLQLSACTTVSAMADIAAAAEHLRQSIDFSLLTGLSAVYAANLERELLILLNLMQAQRGILRCCLPDTMAFLYTVRRTLHDWRIAAYPTTHQERTFRADLKSRLTFSSLPSTMLFWNRLLESVLSAATFAFRAALTFDDLDTITAAKHPIDDEKLGVDYMDMISVLLKQSSRHLQTTVALIYLVPANSDQTVDYNGYSLPWLDPTESDEDEQGYPAEEEQQSASRASTPLAMHPASGLSRFPVLFSHPRGLSVSEHVNIVSIYTTSSALPVGSTIPFVDSKLQRSFYTMRLTQNHLLCVVATELASPTATPTLPGETKTRQSADIVGYLHETLRAFTCRNVLDELVFS
ncbi:hypothetical protein RI367_006030 [Sorochytrium milnesiophthora]